MELAERREDSNSSVLPRGHERMEVIHDNILRHASEQASPEPMDFLPKSGKTLPGPTDIYTLREWGEVYMSDG